MLIKVYNMSSRNNCNQFEPYVDNCCGYKYYNQDLSGKEALTDQFLRFLLCNEKKIRALYASIYAARQFPSKGLYYCYTYFSIFDPNPTVNNMKTDSKRDRKLINCVGFKEYNGDPNNEVIAELDKNTHEWQCENCNCVDYADAIDNSDNNDCDKEKECNNTEIVNECGNCGDDNKCKQSKVYQSYELFYLYLVAEAMKCPNLCQNNIYNTVINERKIPKNVYLNQYVNNEFQKNNINYCIELEKLCDIDLQVILLLYYQKQIEQFYVRGVAAFHYVSQAKEWCIQVNFKHDLCGRELVSRSYSGRALKELFFTYSSAFGANVQCNLGCTPIKCCTAVKNNC